MRPLPCLTMIVLLLALPLSSAAAEPDYREWDRLLERYYDPARGMDYAALRSQDAAALADLRQALSRVDPEALSRDEQLAYWINLYNVSIVGVVVANYPIGSIRQLSTDPVIRLNVFRQKLVPLGSDRVSLDFIEHETIRKHFRDPRIHFAINCAARSCPPLREEAYRGSTLGADLDDQVRRFVNGPRGVRLTRRGSTLIVRTTKIMDWFEEDFAASGGALAFLRAHLASPSRAVIDSARTVKVAYHDYDWKLNDWKRQGVS